MGITLIYDDDYFLKFLIKEGSEDQVCLLDTGSDCISWPSWRYGGPIKKERRVVVRVGATEKTESRGWRNTAKRLHVYGLGDLMNVPITVTEVADPFKSKQKDIYMTDIYPVISAFFLWGRTFQFDFSRPNRVRLMDISAFKPRFPVACTRLLREGNMEGLFIRLPFILEGKPACLLLDTGLPYEKLVLNPNRVKLTTRGRISARIADTGLNRILPYSYSNVLASDVDGLVGWRFFNRRKLLIDTTRNVGDIQ